ncbi:hypothetical protein ACIPLC_00675 [Kitasatospora sp. NPDC086801]|uniref:hypothetical protein n=1 Tax=Kitasatospora sp. NPDC086801 TaxID=3364066 RepID=UPI00381E09D4
MPDPTDTDWTSDRPVIRAVPHPGALDQRGITITCPKCDATRDWLLLNVRAQVFVRCRCTAEWHEPGLTRAYFDEHFTVPEREWADFDAAMRALAFDGLLAGSMWD